jgi:GTP cyclohydrolase I
VQHTPIRRRDASAFPASFTTQTRQAITTDSDKIETGVRLILEGLGVDADDSNFRRTPQRVAKVDEEIFLRPKTDWPVFDEDYTDMVILRGHTF